MSCNKRINKFGEVDYVATAKTNELALCGYPETDLRRCPVKNLSCETLCTILYEI